MNTFKIIKDRIVRYAVGDTFVPKGLLELRNYFIHYGPINFKYEVKDGLIIAMSTNFRHGSIVTSGETQEELDSNIKDAILTSFELPSSYAKEANIHKEGSESNVYALA